MKINIEQTLHGYEDGHQLLMSSSELSEEASKILLVQSDLSGSNIDEGFKTYITGYPLKSSYVFSKTWYADEMKRPGCVWTHSLLIPFSDLGKIPDLEQLLNCFIRPIKDQYKDYSIPILIDLIELHNSNILFDNLEQIAPVINDLYSYYNQTIIVPATNSMDFELPVVQIWSNQWPRLRRNFSFCTGSLSLKSLGNKDFDLQIIPFRNINLIDKHSVNLHIVNTNFKSNNPLLKTFFDAPKNKIRKFLWVFGSDIQGDRRNYAPLVNLFEKSLQKKPKFEEVNKLINESFSDNNEGNLIKTKIYQNSDLFAFDEKEVLQYLVTNENININSYEQFQLSYRLVEALNKGVLTVNEFAQNYSLTLPLSLSEQILSKISISNSEMINLILKNRNFVKYFKTKLASSCNKIDIWQLPFEIQRDILDVLFEIETLEWTPIISAILESKSAIIEEVINCADSTEMLYIVEYFDKNSYPNHSIKLNIFRNHKTTINSFIKGHLSVISSATCQEIFQYYNYEDLVRMDLNGSEWIQIFRKLRDEDTKKFSSCVLLSIALESKIRSAHVLIAECFEIVFSYAKNSKIEPALWKIIPVDTSGEFEEEVYPFSFIMNYISWFSPKREQVPGWDFCELLIRTLVNKFSKNKWPEQSFVDALKSEETFRRAIMYSFSFKKGSRFLKSLVINITKQKVRLYKHQIEVFNKIKPAFKN